MGIFEVPEDSRGFQEIPGDFRRFWGFFRILEDSLRILEVSSGFFEKCTRFLKCRTYRNRTGDPWLGSG